MEPEALNTQSPQAAETTRRERSKQGFEPEVQSNSSPRADHRWRIRIIAALVALIPLSALCLARNLEPSSSGLGTHQQLGLPPCSMRLLLGIRCPGCGMTTSWAHFTRGHWRASVETSVGGFLFAILAVWVAFLGIRTTFTAQFPGPGTQQLITLTAAGIFLVSLLQWVQRLMA